MENGSLTITQHEYEGSTNAHAAFDAWVNKAIAANMSTQNPRRNAVLSMSLSTPQDAVVREWECDAALFSKEN
jgi:hypothetical protein